VIVNLAGNVQAMAHAGSPRRKITIRTTMPGPAAVRCTVEDSGPGIPPEHLDHMFESFFTTKQGGMGMGLSICRSIVEAHGGSIAADNGGVDGGALFSFTVPVVGRPD
jgi:signal transduction histidine kinase